MRDKIAEIVKDCLFRAGDKEKASYVTADKILSLLISNPLWKDIDRNIPSLEGIMVEKECECHQLRIEKNPFLECKLCDSTGIITRQATIEDIWDIRELIMHLDHIANHSECSMSKDWAKSALYTKSGGRLVIKNDEKD